jgi:hypothetical protein
MSSDPHLRGEYAFVSSDESRFGFGFESKKLITYIYPLLPRHITTPYYMNNKTKSFPHRMRIIVDIQRSAKAGRITITTSRPD